MSFPKTRFRVGSGVCRSGFYREIPQQ